MVQNFQEAFDIVGVKIRSIFTSIRVYEGFTGEDTARSMRGCGMHAR